MVMVAVGDPVKNGFVRSFAQPGGNITGLSSLAQGIASKQVEFLKEIVTTSSCVQSPTTSLSCKPSIRGGSSSSSSSTRMQRYRRRFIYLGPLIVRWLDTWRSDEIILLST
jgi:hypothetical protein